MGLFDKMVGSGASLADPNAQRRFEELKLKYQSVLSVMEQHQVQLQNLHVQDNKLFIKGTALSDEARNTIWNQIKQVDANYETDLTCDLGTHDDKTGVHGAGGSW